MALIHCHPSSYLTLTPGHSLDDSSLPYNGQPSALLTCCAALFRISSRPNPPPKDPAAASCPAPLSRHDSSPVVMENDYTTHVDDATSDMDMQLSTEHDISLSPKRSSAAPSLFNTSPTSRSRKRGVMSRSQPRPIHTPTSPVSSTLPHNLLPSAPASPPTPAPSPTPMQRAPDWSTAAEHEDAQVRSIRALFSDMNDAEKLRLLGELLNMCNSHQLSFVHDFVSPRLKKDPFQVLPNELCLRVCCNPLRREPAHTDHI